MNYLALSLISAILIGLGATFTTDLWALFLTHAFKIPSPTTVWLGAGFDIYQKESLDIQILDLRRRKVENAQ